MILPYYVELKKIVDIGIEEWLFENLDTKLLHISLLGMCHFFLKNEIVISELVGPDVNMEELEARYVEFVSSLVSYGLLKRKA